MKRLWNRVELRLSRGAGQDSTAPPPFSRTRPRSMVLRMRSRTAVFFWSITVGDDKRERERALRGDASRHGELTSTQDRRKVRTQPVFVVLAALTNWWVLFAPFGLPPLLMMVFGPVMMTATRGPMGSGFAAGAWCGPWRGSEVDRTRRAD